MSSSSLFPNSTVDPFGRVVDYLRISVTDRCDERCLYCMPGGYKGWAQREDHLTSDEIVRTVEAATRLGFRKFRITGGEPLIRGDIIPILERIWELPGVQTLGVSTNGTRLAELAGGLKRAGVRSVNVSLDSMDAGRYRAITGGNLDRVLRGIDAAAGEGFEMIKLNCVLLRGMNEEDYLPLIDFASRRGMPVRFIELMPFSPGAPAEDPRFLSVQELMLRLGATGGLLPRMDAKPGHGPARYFDFLGKGMAAPARVGFIGAMTTEHFCESCNKLRLTADGKLRPCLGRHGEIDLLGILREGGAPDMALREAIANKPENHEFLERFEFRRPMTAIGG